MPEEGVRKGLRGYGLPSLNPLTPNPRPGSIAIKTSGIRQDSRPISALRCAHHEQRRCPMNAITSADAVESPTRLDIPPSPPERPVEWLRAVRALRALLNDPEQTEKALEIFLALDGAHNEGFFQRMLADPQGRRLLGDRPCLLSRLSDREALARLPGGSFGRIPRPCRAYRPRCRRPRAVESRYGGACRIDR